MTANHVFYIPAMILIGFFLGALWGRHTLLRTLAEEEREAREREARKAERARRNVADPTPERTTEAEDSDPRI